MSIIKNNKNYGTRVILLGEPPVPPTPEYFYVEDVSGQANTLSMETSTGTSTKDIYYSTDQINWNYMGETSTTTPITATIPANGKLYLKCNSVDMYQNSISCSGNYNVGGYIMSLIFGDNFQDNLLSSHNTYAFRPLFKNSTNLISAENLVLPINTSNNCYQEMFLGCTSLTQAPVLPATTLANSCYQYMFYDCLNLNSITTYASNISARNCLSQWLASVAETGDLYNLGGATYPSGTSGIPSGWTEHTSL